MLDLCGQLFLMLWHQVAFILLFTSQFTVLINYLCILDTTLRTLNTWDTLHVMNYIIFLYFCPCRDLISIIQSWICHVWTVYIMGVGVDHVFESHIVHFSCVSMLSCSCGLSFWHLKQNVSLSFEPVANVAMYIFREKDWNPPCLHFSPPLIHYHV